MKGTCVTAIPSPKEGDLVSFYDFDLGDHSTGIVLLVEDYDYSPSQEDLKSVVSAHILSNGSTHVVPLTGEFWEVKVINEAEME